MMARFELRSATNGRVVFSLKACNGAVILTSEPLAGKTAAKEGITAVRDSAVVDARYDRRIANNGHHFFLLRSAGGQVLATSERYFSAHALEDGVATVRRSAPDALIQDLTV